MMDWADLQMFAALAEEGSLAAAGRKLGVDHVTVARRVASLEAKTKLKLVDRRQRRTVLTEAGQRVAQRALRMQEEAYGLERALLMSSEDLSGTVTVSLPPLIAIEWIAPAISRFRERHPRLTITLAGEARSASLSRREADIAMRLHRPESGPLVARKIGELFYRLYASEDYIASTPPEDHAYILYDHSLEHLPQQVWLRGIIGQNPRIALCSNDLMIQCAAVAAGAGIAVLPEFASRRRALVDADPEHRLFTREIWLTWHEDLQGQAAISAVAAFLAETVSGASKELGLTIKT